MKTKFYLMFRYACIYFALSLIPGFFFGGHLAVSVFALLWIPHAVVNHYLKNSLIKSSFVLPVWEFGFRYDDVVMVYNFQGIIKDKDGNVFADTEYVQFITPFFLDPLLPAFHIKDGKLVLADRKDAIKHWQELTKQYDLKNLDDKK